MNTTAYKITQRIHTEAGYGSLSISRSNYVNLIKRSKYIKSYAQRKNGKKRKHERTTSVSRCGCPYNLLIFSPCYDSRARTKQQRLYISSVTNTNTTYTFFSQQWTRKQLLEAIKESILY